MIVASAFAALRQVLSPGLRGILWKSIGLTILLLAVLWAAATRGVDWLLAQETYTDAYPWIDTLGVVLAGAGLLVGALYLIPAVSALVASVFADDAAAVVERTDFPGDEPGREVALLPSILYGLRFFALTLAVNLVALALLLVPVVNIAAFFVANAYLLSREYFELAANRHLPRAEATAMRKRNAGRVFLAGAIVAAFLLIPIVNLATPLFGVALMTHLYKRIERAEGARGRTIAAR
ncbi:sulfate transporter family protein [Salinarimonas ramus]|uniref:Cysteine biosynthesis protein n=1 Tax=Salinarimonas ramus TaxID=690164 RepID=A0A917Q6R8_9HYPH|nr:sulfate transporter family protein [Salinarimonas ramus]GGK32193.1 cysteine biosynthesis protein [Salinarimonas ramus]